MLFADWLSFSPSLNVLSCVEICQIYSWKKVDDDFVVFDTVKKTTDGSNHS